MVALAKELAEAEAEVVDEPLCGGKSEDASGVRVADVADPVTEPVPGRGLTMAVLTTLAGTNTVDVTGSMSVHVSSASATSAARSLMASAARLLAEVELPCCVEPEVELPCCVGADEPDGM